MLYIIGLGLGDEKDITLKGLEAVKNCQKVYMEAYTSLLSFGLSTHGLSSLEKLYGKSINLADREVVEEKADDILMEAHSSNVAFLVVGDPFGYGLDTEIEFTWDLVFTCVVFIIGLLFVVWVCYVVVS